MKNRHFIALLLSFALTAILLAPGIYALDSSMQTVHIQYVVNEDEQYGAPGMFGTSVSQYPGDMYIVAGQQFVLPARLSSDDTIGINVETGVAYYGRWEFSNWSVPSYMVCKLESSGANDDTVDPLMENAPVVTPQYLCCTLVDGTITGSWSFFPEYALAVPDTLDTGDEPPLSWLADKLSQYWPGRAAEMSRIFETGIFPESVISYMDENIRTIPLQNREFASVPLCEIELYRFLTAMQDVYEALVMNTEKSAGVRVGINALMGSAANSGADMSTAFVVYCAERAGLLEGKSKSMLRTANLTELYDFLKNVSCADFLTADELLSQYAREVGSGSAELIYNDQLISFAQEESAQDATTKKSSVQLGDLIVFKNVADMPVSLGIVDAVEGHSISYVSCDSNGIPSETTFNEDELRELNQTGTKTEFISLRSYDIPRIVYQFLVNDLHLPKESALGVMGNLYFESKFSPIALGDNYTSFGLCQWHNGRFLNLVIFCLENNYNVASLEGQLRFLAYELQTTYPALLNNLILNAHEGKDWIRESAYAFCRYYEQPAKMDVSCALRGAMAQGAVYQSFSELFTMSVQLHNISLSAGSIKPAEEPIPAEEQSAEQPTEQQTKPQTEAQPVQTAEPTQEQSEFVNYTVQYGDSMAIIFASFRIDYASYKAEVMELNNLSNENMLSVGQTLIFRRTMLNTA